MLSIVIPTMNEEKHLKKLLQSIEKQDFDNYEVIIADNGSKDKTLEIAKKYKCKIVKGGSPARGRNNGAKVAKGERLLFLDADVVLPKRVFGKILKEFKKRNLGIATFFLAPIEKSKKKKLASFFFTFFYNIPIFLLEKTLPHAAMGILIEKKLFNKLNGYNEDITLAEDHDLARRAGKLSKYGILKSVRLHVSDRRFEKEGWFKTYSKYLLCEGHMIFIGPVKKDIFKYNFDHLKNKKK
ncbi:glycosyltransferase [Patescibacteria group bacterium]|nr:glycosyltransferase [Patescibacteria group bacterium]